MRASWFFSCQLHVRNSVVVALSFLISATTLTIVLQSVYLHQYVFMQVSVNDRSQLMKTVIGNKRVVPVGTRELAGSVLAQTGDFLPFQWFGKEHFIVRFSSKNSSKFELLDRLRQMGKTFTIFQHVTHDKATSFYNGNRTLHHENPGSYFVARNENIYLMSAIARYKINTFKDYIINAAHNKSNTSLAQDRNLNSSVQVTRVVFSGWLKYVAENTTLKCCFLLNNKTIVIRELEKRMLWTQINYQPFLASKHFCPVPRPFQEGRQIAAATLSFSNMNCHTTQFMHVEYPEIRKSETLAICAKIAYADLSAQRLVEWMETQIFLGVDKVVMYFYNLNTATMRVLKHYASSGFVELRPFDFPLADKIPRYIGQKDAKPFIDEQVVVYDCMERMYGYTYAAVIDVDEYIYARVARRHQLKDLLARLRRRDQMAAGFSFRTELFITDWDNSKNNRYAELDLLWHARFQNRTRPLDDRTKNIFIMDRVIIGSVWTHNYTAIKGYTKYKVPASVATLKHYRPCRFNWNCYLHRGYRDQTMVKLFKEISGQIKWKFSKLDIDLDPVVLQGIDYGMS